MLGYLKYEVMKNDIMLCNKRKSDNIYTMKRIISMDGKERLIIILYKV